MLLIETIKSDRRIQVRFVSQKNLSRCKKEFENKEDTVISNEQRNSLSKAKIYMQASQSKQVLRQMSKQVLAIMLLKSFLICLEFVRNLPRVGN
jgi:hypothetical protein